MKIDAALHSLELTSSNPQALAQFYAKTFCLEVARDEADPAVFIGSADGRELRFVAGGDGLLRRAVYAFHSTEQFHAHKAALLAASVELLEQQADRYSVADPDGRLLTFLAAAPAQQQRVGAAPTGPQVLQARLQHFALRSPTPTKLVDFYVNRLGFVLSDRVLDAAGDLTAAFLRTDREHHSLAIFRAPKGGFDHFSCETPDWLQLRDWADHMARTGTDLAWGIGRHGPGNDTFLMVRDQDGNMGEVSCDLEVCASDRPVGVWEHRPQTLNQWGVAIMRS